MKSAIAKSSLGVLALLWSATSVAATVTMVPDTPNNIPTNVSTSFSVTVHADLMPYSGGAVLGLTWDPTKVTVTGIVLATGAPFDTLQNVAGFGSFVVANTSTPSQCISGPCNFNVVTIHFATVASANGPANIALVDNGNSLCWGNPDTFDCIDHNNANGAGPDVHPVYTPLNVIVGPGPGPSILVTDSVAPTDNHAIPFGSITRGQTATQTVTITNAGTANLHVGTLAALDTLAAPFSLLNDTCSGLPLTPMAQCTVGVRFSPTSSGDYSDSFDVVSDDPAHPSVTINVTGNSPFIQSPAVTDAATTTVNTAVAIAIAQNDVGLIDPVSVALFNSPLHGTVQFSGSPGPQAGVLATYTPATGFAGLDSFQYAIFDGVNAGVATVNVTVTPNAVNDNATTDIAQPVTIYVLANDLGFVDPVTVGIVAVPGHGTLTVNGSPGPKALVSVTYTPNGHLLEPDAFVYSATSSSGTDNATVVIDVTGIDTDGDLVADQFDNCTLIGNPNQRDTNGDGYGNLCDPDFNGDGTVNVNDFNRLKARLNIFPVIDVDTDLDGNGAVNVNDLNRLKSFLGRPPGPSGLHPNCPPTCP